MRRWWRIGMGGMVAIAAFGAVVAQEMISSRASAAPAQQVDGGSGLEELAERLLAPPYPGPDGQVQTVQLLAGRLPADLPLQLPTPPNGRLLGSAVRGSGGRTAGTDVVLDAAGTATEVLDFYQSELARQGWTAAPTGPGGPRGGFQPASMPVTSMFCRGQSGPWLSMTVVPKAGGLHDVRMHLETVHPGPCAQPPGLVPPGIPPGSDLLPPLHAPTGVNVQIQGMGGGPNRWSSEASAETGRSAAELEAHFAPQLQAAGWVRQAGQAQAPLAWSTWRVPGEGDWHGFLFVLESAGQDRRSLHVHVESATASFQPYPAPPAMPVPALPSIRPPVPQPSPAPLPPPTATPR